MHNKGERAALCTYLIPPQLERDMQSSAERDGIDGMVESPLPMTFPDVLHRSCVDLASATRRRDVLLFLYDDIAESFSISACHGESLQGLQGMVPCDEDIEALGRALQDVQPVRAELHDALTHASIDCLLVPLWDGMPVGIAAFLDGEREQAMVWEQIETAARSAARRIRAARPDVDHACLFRDILEVDPGGIAVVEGPDYVFSYATLAFRHMMTRETVPFLGRSARDVLQDGLNHDGESLLEKVHRTGETLHLTQVEVADEYGVRYYELHLLPRRSTAESGDANYIILWPRTDAVLTHRALEASIHQLGDSQGLLSAVLNGTNNGIVFTDRDGMVQYVNRRGGELWGIEISQIVGRHITEVVSRLKDLVADPVSFEERMLADADTIQEGVPDELEILHPSRRLLDRYHAPVYSERGQPLGRVDVYTDVTETRNLQRSKDDFLSLVSHELKTPVTSIKGYSQLLKRRATRESLSEGILNACTVIERQVERMEGLIDTLLDLSRLETGQLALSIEHMDLRALALRVGEMIQLTQDTHVIDLDVSPGPIWIDGDVNRLEQVLTNLLTNAVRFSAVGSTITVSLRDGDPVELQVTDEGQGIPDSMQPYIFERFYRGGDLQKSNGMGIGLYITRGIVERHGGTIAVRSHAGEGAAFTVCLPRTQPGGSAQADNNGAS